MSAVLELAQQLIACRSVTPNDAGCQSLLKRELEHAGFICESLRFDDVDNLWAVHGSRGPLLVFAGHTDVVPSGPLEHWASDPFTPTVKDGKLYGRGAADMKGGVAAMLVAAQRFTAAHPDHAGRIGLLITSDEEGVAVNGTARVIGWLKQRGEKIDWCVLGEPSSLEQFGDTVRNGRRGSLSGRLEVHGIQGHVAYPERADNPIQCVLPALVELCATRWDTGSDHFPPTRFQISNFNAGTGAGNVIPGTAVIQFNFRYSSAVSVDDLQHRVEEILSRHGVRYSLVWQPAGDPFLTPPGKLSGVVQEAVEKVTGIRPRLDTGGGTSDGRFIAPTGAEVVEFGPLNASIHKLNECVSLDELDKLADIYLGIMQALLPA